MSSERALKYVLRSLDKLSRVILPSVPKWGYFLMKRKDKNN